MRRRSKIYVVAVSEAVIRSCTSKQFFSKISQTLQKSVCVGVTFGPERLQLD